MSPGCYHIATLSDGESLRIKGMNIWKHKWKNTGQQIDIKDPLYNQAYSFEVYTISILFWKAEFAAGEFSNGIYGIYIK